MLTTDCPSLYIRDLAGVAVPMCCLYRPDLTRLAARLASIVRLSGVFAFVVGFFIEVIIRKIQNTSTGKFKKDG